MHPKDEWRIRQAASKDEWVVTSPVYLEFQDQIYRPNSSAADCVQFYVDRTIALAANPNDKRELDNFVTMLGGSMWELAARTPYHDDRVRSKLVDFVHQLRKVVIKDLMSETRQPLLHWEDHESVLWKDLPEFWLACAEERISFVEIDPINTPWEMERWKNLTAFWAGLTNFPDFDESGHAFIALEDTLEPPEEIVEAGNRTFLVQTACIWLIYGIGWIWSRTQGEAEGWQREKWEQWKKGLKDSRDVDSEDETRALVDEALTAMGNAEDGN